MKWTDFLGLQQRENKIDNLMPFVVQIIGIMEKILVEVHMLLFEHEIFPFPRLLRYDLLSGKDYQSAFCYLENNRTFSNQNCMSYGVEGKALLTLIKGESTNEFSFTHVVQWGIASLYWRGEVNSARVEINTLKFISRGSHTAVKKSSSSTRLQLYLIKCNLKYKWTYR